MGYQSTIVIQNDFLHELARDPDVGRKLFAAIIGGSKGEIAGLEGAMLVGISPSVDTAVYRVGGNIASYMGGTGSCHDSDEDVVKALAGQVEAKNRRDRS